MIEANNESCTSVKGSTQKHRQSIMANCIFFQNCSNSYCSVTSSSGAHVVTEEYAKKGGKKNTAKLHSDRDH